MVSTFSRLPYLPRAPGKGIFQVTAGCRAHNSAIPLLVKLAYIEGLPLKSVGGREKVSLSTMRVMALRLPNRSCKRMTVLAGTSRKACPHMRRSYLLASWKCVPGIPCIQFSKSGGWKLSRKLPLIHPYIFEAFGGVVPQLFSRIFARLIRACSMLSVMLE